jgi:hypothetical protein
MVNQIGSVHVKADIAMVPPATMTELSKLISPLPCPHVASEWIAAPDVRIRACPAVPEASAVVSDVIAFAVATPEEFVAPKAVAPKVSVPPSVPAAASATFVGWAVLRIWIVPLLRRATRASLTACLVAVACRAAIAVSRGQDALRSTKLRKKKPPPDGDGPTPGVNVAEPESVGDGEEREPAAA